MIPIIIVIAGIYILIKGKINFSKNKELVKPKSIFVGVSLIISGVIGFLNVIVALGLLILIMIISYFLSQNTSNVSSPNQFNTKYLVIIGVIILVTFFVIFFYMLNAGLNPHF